MSARSSEEVTAELQRQQEALATIISESSLSSTFKARLIALAKGRTSGAQSRDGVLDALIYFEDLCDIGGEDAVEIIHVKLRIYKLSLALVVRDSGLSPALKAELLTSVDESVSWAEMRRKVIDRLASASAAGEDSAAIRRIEQEFV